MKCAALRGPSGSSIKNRTWRNRAGSTLALALLLAAPSCQDGTSQGRTDGGTNSDLIDGGAGNEGRGEVDAHGREARVVGEATQRPHGRGVARGIEGRRAHRAVRLAHRIAVATVEGLREPCVEEAVPARRLTHDGDRREARREGGGEGGEEGATHGARYDAKRSDRSTGGCARGGHFPRKNNPGADIHRGPVSFASVADVRRPCDAW